MSWQTYKGLELPSTPTGDAGINLKDDLKLLADRSLSASAIPGSVIFVGGTTGSPVLEDDVGKFCWDSTNHRLGVGTASPLELVQIQGDGGGLLMATGTTSATSETTIIFGAGTSATTQFQRIRFIYGAGDLFFERKASDGTWSGIMKLDWTLSRVDVTGSGLMMATDPADANGETQILFGRAASNAQYTRIWYVFSDSDLKFQRRQTAGGTWTTMMTLDWANSRVGIGTESPTTLLDVDGAVTLGGYAGTVANPPNGRAVFYIDNSNSAHPVLKLRFANGTTLSLAPVDERIEWHSTLSHFPVVRASRRSHFGSAQEYLVCFSGDRWIRRQDTCRLVSSRSVVHHRAAAVPLRLPAARLRAVHHRLRAAAPRLVPALPPAALPPAARRPAAVPPPAGLRAPYAPWRMLVVAWSWTASMFFPVRWTCLLQESVPAGWGT